MEKVIPVIINGEPQLIDEAELRNICALENIPYDSPPPSVGPPNTVELSPPSPKEIQSEPVQAPVPPPLSVVNSQPLTLIQSGNIVTVPISNQEFSTVGDTVLVSTPEQVDVLSANPSDVIYPTEELHIDPSQTVADMILRISPSHQKENLVVANEYKSDTSELTKKQVEFSPANGLQGIGSFSKIVLNPKSNQKEICDLYISYKGVIHRVIVPFAQADLQTDPVVIGLQARDLFGDVDKGLVGVVVKERIQAAPGDRQLEESDMGVVASLDATPITQLSEGSSIAQHTQIGQAQMAPELALHAQHVQVAQPQNIYFRTTTGQQALVSPTQMIVRPPTALIMPATPVTLGHTMTQALILPSQNVVTVGGGQMYRITSLPTDDKMVVQVPNQNVLPKPETPKLEETQKSVSNGIKDSTGGGKPDELNQLVEVSYAHCENCGHNSRDLKVCQKCRRPLPKDAKIISQKVLPASVSTTKIDKETPKKKKCQRKKKFEEPVTLSLLSSDEEDGENSSSKRMKLPSTVVKEPIITNGTVAPYGHERIEGGGLDLADIITSPDVERALLQCRTVRIGSYKTVPEGKVAITEYGLYIKIPALDTKEMVTVKIFKNEIVKILGNFGKTVPVLFYYTTANAAEKIRRILQMYPPEQHRGPYYDPTSSAQMHRRIMLLPEKISEETRLFLKCTYDNQCLLENLSLDEANAILMNASPSEAQVDVSTMFPFSRSPMLLMCSVSRVVRCHEWLNVGYS
uniref:Uncharacterized protein n=1 Tax=Lygus hesperus TaxID=30085 RepID=A0A0K8SIL6_LYGHE